MAEPWLTIIGIGEDGMDGLSKASRAALAAADTVFGGPRHLALADAGTKGRAWPIPFSIEPVLAQRGRPTAVLASGDPFWFGAGGSLAATLTPDEFRAYPAPSTFSLAAARLGWPLEQIGCFGLHAAEFTQLLPALVNNGRAICLLRDGPAAGVLAQWLTTQGFGPSRLHILEALGGARERQRIASANSYDLDDVAAPVAMAIEMRGTGGLSRAAGLPDASFAHDGQITKSPIRALTLSALAPRQAELLWDIGAGSGSISVEWCLAGGKAIAVETRPDRAANIRANASVFGIADRLQVIEGTAPHAFANLPPPAAVFIGGGANDTLLMALWAVLPASTRLVANAVTLETEALLTLWHAKAGGNLLRIELASAAALGSSRGWTPARPVVQWSTTR
jgi:precorrin-6Y C5,15-methyltransferase (decarboxylating)